MDEELRKKERELEHLSVEEEISEKRRLIAERKALERDAKARHGSNWKKIVGIAGSMKPNMEAIQTLYASDPGLREMSKPSKLRKL